MKYWVIGPDGQKFGPADVDTLNRWVVEKRVDAHTELEDADTGTRLTAASVAGLVLGAAPQTAQTQADPLTKPVETPTPTAASPYAQAPMTQSPYPRGATYNPMVVPAELTGKFNFGAFALTWIWGLNHKAYITLIALGLGLLGMIPNVGCFTGVLQLGFSIWIGLKANEWAWQSGRFATPEECIACQRVWMWWGIAIFVLSIVFGVIAVVAGMAAVMAGMGTGQPR